MIRAYAHALPGLQAERQLLAIEAASVPYMSDSSRRDTFRKYTAEVGRETRPAAATADDLAAIGITVQHVPADPGTARDDTEGDA